MRKISIFFLCLLFVFISVGCKEKDNKSSHSVDIKYFADMGAIPECDYKIGDNLPDDNTIEESGMVILNDQSPAFIMNGAFYLYYDRKDDKPKFQKIAAFDTAFGFENGSITIEISDVLDEQNIEYTEREPDKDELFFLPKGDGRTVIECTSLKHNLIFVFEENALCATLLG